MIHVQSERLLYTCLMIRSLTADLNLSHISMFKFLEHSQAQAKSDLLVTLQYQCIRFLYQQAKGHEDLKIRA